MYDFEFAFTIFVLVCCINNHCKFYKLHIRPGTISNTKCKHLTLNSYKPEKFATDSDNKSDQIYITSNVTSVFPSDRIVNAIKIFFSKNQVSVACFIKVCFKHSK